MKNLFSFRQAIFGSRPAAERVTQDTDRILSGLDAAIKEGQAAVERCNILIEKNKQSIARSDEMIKELRR